MKPKISITQKHFIYFLFLCLFSIFIVGTYSFYISKKSISERTFNQLTSVRVEKIKKITTFFKDRNSEVEILSDYLITLSKIYNNDYFLEKSTNFLNAFIRNKPYFSSIFIIYGQNIFEVTNDTLIKQDVSSYYKKNSNKPLINAFQKIQNADTIVYFDYNNHKNEELSLLIAKTLNRINDKELSLFFRVSSNQINSLMTTDGELSGLGKTGESYIVGEDFLLRTSSRFKPNSIKNIEVKTIAAKNALNNMSGTHILKDYRKVDVLSSYSPLFLKNLKWAIIAEIDKKEALSSVYDLRNSIVILCLVLSLFIFGLVYLGSLKITNPLKQLSEGANKISEGDFNVKIENNSNDEIGELIIAFNNMARVLFLQQDQLNKEQILKISYVLDAQEKERQRLSRDLHDGLGQLLLAAKLKLEQILTNEPEKAKIHLLAALDLLKETIQEIRTISNNLMPSVLSTFGITEGIQRLCKDLEKDSGINLKFNCQNLKEINLSEKTQLYIFRIIQELLNNIIKHSKAKNASLGILIENSNIQISVIDDGIGFDTSKINYGNGIKNIIERTELLGGEINLSSFTDLGTEITLKIPYNEGKN